jgi:PqqD family protein of HPr-rel-A system
VLTTEGNTSRWQRGTECISTEVDDMRVLFGIESGKYVALNVTAERIWEMLADPLTEDEIVTRLQAQFAVDAATCRTAVDRTLAELARTNLVRHV